VPGLDVRKPLNQLVSHDALGAVHRNPGHCCCAFVAGLTYDQQLERAC
jgi:hypothetical protein